MLRAIFRALKAAVTALIRVLERGWDGAWRLVLSPVRALLGPAAPEQVDYDDADTEMRLNRLIENAEAVEPTLRRAEAAAQHAALDAVVEAEEPADETADAAWRKRLALEWLEQRERENERGEQIHAAMLADDLARLDEAQALVLAELDPYDREAILRMKEGVDIVDRVDDLVRGFACVSAHHERLTREGFFDAQEPATAPSPGM